MDSVRQKWKKTPISKTWEHCKPFGSSSTKSSSCKITKTKAWPCKRKLEVAPEGCFSVYVGPQKQRFVIKVELANHPLFKMLLEDAESEYGYATQGPITLPCDVDLFYKVLAEMESAGDEIGPGCFFVKSSLIVWSASRRPNHRVHDTGGYGAYRLLSPSRMTKMNGF